MSSSKDVKVVSVHGYFSSHNTGYEAAVREALSGKHDFHAVNLLGHEDRASSYTPMPIHDLLKDAREQVEKLSGPNTYLIGTSLGAYPILEHLQIRPKGVIGAALIRPVVDARHTLALPNAALEPFRSRLKPEEAMEKHPYGTRKQPFTVYKPVQLLLGRKDQVTGDESFVKGRIQGDGLMMQILEGPHDDKDEERLRKDIETAVRTIKTHLDLIR